MPACPSLLHQRLRDALCPALFIALAAGASAGARAQGFETARLYGAAPGQSSGTFGLGAVSAPAYKGSDDRKLRVLPLIDYQWASGWFAGTGNGLGYATTAFNAVHYGVRLTADFGRSESASEDLRGMGNSPVRPELGVFVNTALSRSIFLSSSLRAGSGEDRHGVVLDLGAGWSSVLAPDWRLGLGVGASLVNASAMNSAFGVNAEQAARSGYAEYRPGGGLRDVRVNAALTWQLAPGHSLTTALSDTVLMAQARDSPLTRRSHGLSMVIGSAWSF